MRRRVVVTGLGLITPLGTSVQTSWKNLLAGESGIKKLPEDFESSVKIAASVQYDPSNYFTKTEEKRLSKFMQFALIAADEALRDADWINLNEKQKARTGVCIGSGIGSIRDILETNAVLSTKGERKVSPFFVPRLLINLAGHVSLKYGFGGPNHSVSTACATGANAIGDASRFIEYGDADVIIAGGSESSINPLSIAGFSSLRALSTNFNENPNKASRPFDKDRDGFVMGEGAGVLVLEVSEIFMQEYNHAIARGAKIYAELSGYGLSGDAHHITAPSPDGRGAARAMKRAIELSNIMPQDIDYVNAHATSTPIGDIIEYNSIKSVCGESTSVSSTKGSVGHLLGAAGSVEAIFTILALSSNIIPPTLNLECLDPEISGLEIVGNGAKDTSNIGRRSGSGKGIKMAMTNSFGFGGTNASLVFKKAQ